jgi:hypothetical protein
MDAKNSQEQLGKLTPAQVVKCAEGSNTVCWVQAETLGDGGGVTSYECCGGAGQTAHFTVKTSFLSPKTISPGDVPDGLIWSRRFV